MLMISNCTFQSHAIQVNCQCGNPMSVGCLGLVGEGQIRVHFSQVWVVVAAWDCWVLNVFTFGFGWGCSSLWCNLWSPLGLAAIAHRGDGSYSQDGLCASLLWTPIAPFLQPPFRRSPCPSCLTIALLKYALYGAALAHHLETTFVSKCSGMLLVMPITLFHKAVLVILDELLHGTGLNCLKNYHFQLFLPSCFNPAECVHSGSFQLNVVILQDWGNMSSLLWLLPSGDTCIWFTSNVLEVLALFSDLG